MQPKTRRLSLTPHPGMPCEAVRRIDVRVSRPRPDTLALAYTLQADLARVRVPAQRPAGRADGLWRHTCFEAFVRSGAAAAYRELNFSPSTQWAAYLFSGYRTGMAPDVEQAAPQLALRTVGDELTLAVKLLTPQLTDAPSVDLALAAVIESDDGSLSYWALRHPVAQPDFHHPDSFALELGR